MIKYRKIKQLINNSFFWVSIEQFGVLGIQFIGTIILARILTPKEFGVIGILTIFIAISATLADSGMGASLVREKEVTKKDYSTLFIYNGLISLLIYLLLFTSAGYIADFYHIPEIKLILRVLSLSILINSLTITQGIHIIRGMNFKALAIISITSILLAVILAILLALNGFGVWALVGLQIIQSFIKAILMFCYIKFIPNFVFDVISFKKQFNFGVHLMFSSLLNMFNTNVYSSVIGKVFTLGDTGYYTQSSKLQALPVGLFTSIVEKATYAILSRKSNIEEVKNTLISHSKKIYLITFILFVFLSVLSKELIYVILGDKWVDGAWIFSLLCIAGIPMIIKTLFRIILKTIGETSFIFKAELLSSIVGLLILSISVFISFHAIIVGIVINSFISLLLFSYYVNKYSGYLYKEQILVVLPFLIYAALFYLFLTIISNMISHYSSFLQLCICSMTGLIVTLFFFCFIDKNKYI